MLPSVEASKPGASSDADMALTISPALSPQTLAVINAIDEVEDVSQAQI